MELATLITELSQPRAYPFPAPDVTVFQTHISAVFLAGPFAYKVKKPVTYGFLDFGTLERRRHFCEQEVMLNRRLAPQVYLGVVPISQGPAGLQVEGAGPVVEWAVKMERLPDGADLRARLRRGELGPELVEAVARRLAAFHQTAATSPAIAAFGRFDAVARSIREIFTQSQPHVGTTVSQAVFARLRALTEEQLTRWQERIEQRAARGMPRDCHGDLHIDHIYWFADRAPPGDLVIVDCIEFTDRFRYIDPVSDMAFPVMDFTFLGRPDLARVFGEAYFTATGDEDGRPLLPLYASYRAAVRGSVEGLKLAEKEVPAAERAADLEQARGYWQVALGHLEAPARRPCLVLVAGLPGSGKSSLGQRLAELADFTMIRSDVVRKELAGLPESAPSPPELRSELYSSAMSERTYDECLRRAGELIFEGRRVIVDANFRQDQQRRLFLDAAVRWGVPALLLHCQAAPAIIQQRLQGRKGDASDADWQTYQQLAAAWEEASLQTRSRIHCIHTGGSLDEAAREGMLALRELGVAEEADEANAKCKT